MRAILVILVVCRFVSADVAPLDPPYLQAQPPTSGFGSYLNQWPIWAPPLPNRNDMKTLISYQSSVKHQIKRGVCSIFSAIGILESLIKRKNQVELDLSENYLSYIVVSRIQRYPSRGSNAFENFLGVKYPGVIDESVWPYEGDNWLEDSLTEEETKRRDQVCSFDGMRQEMCLTVHQDPVQDPFQEPAREWSKVFKTQNVRAERIADLYRVYQLLTANEPLLLELDFFYGAWNHPKMADLGIGERNLEQWTKGIVGIPLPDDIYLSRRKPAGHSIVLVGFDNDSKVYFFKNSWGTNGFGKESDLLGQDTTPGYGSIPYEYAHRWGTFYQITGY